MALFLRFLFVNGSILLMLATLTVFSIASHSTIGLIATGLFAASAFISHKLENRFLMVAHICFCLLFLFSNLTLRKYHFEQAGAAFPPGALDAFSVGGYQASYWQEASESVTLSGSREAQEELKQIMRAFPPCRPDLETGREPYFNEMNYFKLLRYRPSDRNIDEFNSYMVIKFVSSSVSIEAYYLSGGDRPMKQSELCRVF